MGRELWSSGYGRRLTFWRSWVRIPVPYTGWAFFTLICCKLVLMFVWKRLKINEKEVGDGPFLKQIGLISSLSLISLFKLWTILGLFLIHFWFFRTEYNFCNSHVKISPTEIRPHDLSSITSFFPYHSRQQIQAFIDRLIQFAFLSERWC